MIYFSPNVRFWARFSIFCVVGIFIFGVLLIYSQVFILYGQQKERAGKQCVDPIAMQEWNKALDLATTACGDARDYEKEINDKEIADLKAEVEQWQGNYRWLKRQNEEKITEENNE